MTMASSYIGYLWSMFINSGYYFMYKQFEQPEDRLQQSLLDWGLDPTNHYDLMRGFNKFIGKDVDTFSESVSIKDLIDDLLFGKPWVGSGTFPGYPSKIQPPKKPLGHIVCVVGMEYENDPYSPSAIIIDDPYGNTMNNWIGGGNDVKIPWNLFVDWMKPVKDPGVFWAHRFFI
jgi:hypothetical protein